MVQYLTQNMNLLTHPQTSLHTSATAVLIYEWVINKAMKNRQCHENENDRKCDYQKSML